MYRPLKKLGKGGFATVYEVERMTDRHKFAVKAFSKQNTINSDVVNNRLNLVNEINILKKFDNTNVIRLEGIY
jgi:serine/threonine protein kinase